MNDETVFVQTRTLCPGWAKIPAAKRDQAAIIKHRGECQLGCGYSGSDQWVYKYLSLDELREMLGAPSEMESEGNSIAPPAAAPTKRGPRKPKATPDMVVTRETGVAVIEESFLADEDDPLS